MNCIRIIFKKSQSLIKKKQCEYIIKKYIRTHNIDQLVI